MNWANAAAVLALLGATACSGNKTPGGQVVATVDGQEVTQRDLATEIEASNVPANADIKALQPLVVQSVVNRRLLVAQAKRDGLDKTPEYLSAQQRMQDTLLASLLVRSRAAKAAAPSRADVQTYIAQNPHMFSGRQVLLVDEIRSTNRGISDADVRPIHSNDQAAALLQARKQPFQRQRTTLDTLTLPATLARQLLSLPAGEPLAIREGEGLAFVQVVGARPAPVPASATQQVATEALKRQRGSDSIKTLVESLRASANIEYLPGFAPPKQKGASAAS